MSASASLSDLEKIIGYVFKTPDLLNLALRHASADNQPSAVSNERLEFLGDRVLGLVVTDLLYHRFDHEEEGALSRRLTALVRREALARVAGRMDLGHWLVMSAGEEDNGGRENPAILADAAEALIAAIYLDGGLEAARRFIEARWTSLLDEDPTPPKDPKTRLQEWSQSRQLGLPVYTTTDQSGPSHAPDFCITVSVRGHAPQSANGTSKRRAEQEAARALLESIGVDDDTHPLNTSETP